MSIHVQRETSDIELGYEYHVDFLPHSESDVSHLVPVQAAVSLSETGDLADISFIVPKACRSDQALSVIRKHQPTAYVAPRVFLTLPNTTGDAVAHALAELEVDNLGRIVGMQIRWVPAD